MIIYSFLCCALGYFCSCSKTATETNIKAAGNSIAEDKTDKESKKPTLTRLYPDGTIFLEEYRDDVSGEGYIKFYYSSGKKWTEKKYDSKTVTEKSWLKDGRLTAEGSYQSGFVKKNRNGTFCIFEYEIPVIEKYSEGQRIATTDIEGKPVDVTKLRKKTEDELTKEGYGMPIIITPNKSSSAYPAPPSGRP